MKTFTIKSVKWSWADAVQSKNVYRDDEFVETNTREEALEAIDYLMSRPCGLTYTITTFREGKYFTYFRHSMPCLGGLVKYRDSHGERYFMNPYFPRDIYVAFPDGDITYIALYRQNSKDVFKNPHTEFVLSDESPWKSAFGSKDTIIFKDNHFILTNMNTDPTVLYSLMRLGGFSYHGAYGAHTRKSWNPKAEILLTKTCWADPRRLAGQKPIKISGGTWAEGYGYTRPYNESIFKTSLPNKLVDFGKLGGYPKAPYTNEYFLSEMRKKFDLDVSLPMNIKEDNKRAHDILVEAWDYFKEKSSELSDEG